MELQERNRLDYMDAQLKIKEMETLVEVALRTVEELIDFAEASRLQGPALDRAKEWVSAVENEAAGANK